jgi:hypothetical protein
MKLLVLTSEPVAAQELREALPGDVDLDSTEVMIVAPALQDSGIRFWMNDVDGAIARARQVEEESVQQLDSAGVTASGDTGESDPVQAIQDTLETFPADRILLFLHEGEDKRYREDFEPGDLQERFGVPVDTATVSA